MKKLLMAVLLFTGLCAQSRAAKNVQPKKPNIIIILFDDLGYGDLGIYGNPTIKTPHLDRMAQEGMKFTQFYAAASVCTPSRAGLITGRLPIRMGMMSSKRRVLFPNSTKGLPLEDKTIAEELKPQGYATACIGKWHLGDHSPYLPTDRGFDYYYGIPYSNDMGARKGSYRPELPLIRNKEIIEQPVQQNTLTKRYTREALNFIDKNKNQPFFLYLPQTFPHVPLHASSDFKGSSSRGLYGDVVQELDWSVGQILDKLRKSGLAENTLVFATSDNGPWLIQGKNGGSAGLLRGGKGSTWEGGMREPAIAWWPGTIQGGQVSEALATTMDLFSTSLALAGVEKPTDRVIDGVNLMPLLTGKTDQVHDFVWFYRGDRLYSVRKGPWKLQIFTQPGYGHPSRQGYVRPKLVKHYPPLLFNLDEDPSEKYDVADQHPEIISEIMKEVEEHEQHLHPGPDQLAPTADKSTLLENQ